MRPRRVAALSALICATAIPIYLANSQHASALGRMTPSERRCFSVNGAAGGAALVNLTPVLAEGAGDGQLVSSNVVSPPLASNVNYRPGSVDPNVAVTGIGTNGQVCFINSAQTRVHLIADHLGTIAATNYTPAKSNGAPNRVIDTRTGLGGGKLSPSGQVCVTVNGQPGDAALVNLTPILADGPGDGQLVSSNVKHTPSTASNVNFGPGSVDPNVAVAQIGGDGQVCYINSNHTSVHLVADHLGTITGGAYSPATPSGAPDRRVDTRSGLGGGMIGPSGRLCFSVTGAPGDAALVNLTPVLAAGRGDGQLVSSDVTSPPVASNVNYGPGTVDPNVAIAPIGTNGQVCYINSAHTSVHLIADHMGTIKAHAYTPATLSGAPDRRLDTRTETPPPPPTTTVPPVTTDRWNQPVSASNPDLDCSDIRRKVRVLPPDYHRLDADGDGWGCESYG